MPLFWVHVRPFYTQAIARQDPPLYRHIDPGSCPQRSTVTLSFPNFDSAVTWNEGSDHFYTQIIAPQNYPLYSIVDTLTLTIARQDAPWHRGFSTLYSMFTQNGGPQPGTISTPRQLRPAKTLRTSGFDNSTLAISVMGQCMRGSHKGPNSHNCDTTTRRFDLGFGHSWSSRHTANPPRTSRTHCFIWFIITATQLTLPGHR